MCPIDPEEIRARVPVRNPIDPVELAEDSTFQFNCHPGVACFNACCKNIEITLTPYDIVRLKRRLKMNSKQFVAEHTVPYEMDSHGMPGLKLATKPATTQCVFLTERGCSVYEDRPTACRYYALGNMGVRKKDASHVDNVYFIIKETHCLGHHEPRTQTVGEYRAAQGLERYDKLNEIWRELVLKKRSSGSTIGGPSPRSLQLFDMCSYDMDSFREFIQTPGFRDIFDIADNEKNAFLDDDEQLLRFSLRFLNQVLFGEMTIPIKEGARARRAEERRDVWQHRHTDAIDEYRNNLEKQKYEQ